MRTAIVTGGAQGIGRMTTRRLLEQGYAVAVWEADAEALLDANMQIVAQHVLFVQCDVSLEDNVRQAVEQTMQRFGRIDVLINNAGMGIEKPLADFTLDDWNLVMGTNLTGAFLCAKYTAEHIAKHEGCIVNIASTRAFQSEPNTFAYSASKGGLVALTHSLAISLGPAVRVNCISPGWIDVSAIKKTGKANQEPLRPEDHRQHPVGRVGVADDIAHMVLFLIADENSFITGQNFTVDGGMTKKMMYV